MQIAIWLLLAFNGAILLSVSNASIDSDYYNRKNIGRTVIDSNGVRFQKILHRKKRFLLFPPGSALVTTMSYTKSLVPRSPSGINMIGEYDIFYPLQTKIEDWYPTKKPLPTKRPPPEPEENDENEDDDDDSNKGVLPNNIGPIVPQNFPYQRPINPPINAVMDNNSQAFLPTPVNQLLDDTSRLPSDQELGITSATLISDPNFNDGSHPGEIYVDNTSLPKDPPRRSDMAYYKQLLQAQSYHKRYPYSNVSVRPKTIIYKESYRGNDKLKSRRIDGLPSNELYYDNVRPKLYNGQFFSEANVMNERIRYNRAVRERRDLFEQLESSVTFKQFDTKSCILRMICETKHYLLPPGKSLFQDIFRILFTLPVENEYVDEYTEASKASELDCNAVYSKRCQYSILGYFMSKDSPIF